MAASATTLIQRTRRFIGDWPENDATTASVANTSTVTNIAVADSTIYSAGWILQIDTEAMYVTSLPSATTVAVRRGVRGTTVASHASGSTILVRPAFLDIQYLDAINAGIDATFPYYYQPVIDTSLTADGSTYEFTVPNMSSPSIPIPYLSKIDILATADTAYRPLERWEVRRGATPKIKFRSPPQPGTIRVQGFGPFNQLAAADSLSALWPVYGDDVLIEYAANRLLMSGEAQRVRQDTGARDDREASNRLGGSAAAASQLLQRFQLRLQQQPMPPMPRHVIRTI